MHLNEDRLTIDGKVHTVNNLNQLPPDLHPRQLATKEIDNHLFFSEARSLSNYHPSKFTIDGESFSCGEEFIQTQKAKFFKDQQTYYKIKAASTPGEMQFLGRGVQGFDPHTWAKFAPQAAAICQQQKFTQNDNLRMYLLSTGKTCLVEAAPRDSLWGIGMYIFDSQLMSKKSTCY